LAAGAREVHGHLFWRRQGGADGLLLSAGAAHQDVAADLAAGELRAGACRLDLRGDVLHEVVDERAGQQLLEPLLLADVASDPLQLTGLERCRRVDRQLLHLVQHLHSALEAGAEQAQRRLGAGPAAGREQQQGVLELGEESARRLQARGRGARSVVVDTQQAAPGAHVGVVVAGRTAEHLDLDVSGVVRQELRTGLLAPQRAQCVDQRDRDRAGGAEAAMVLHLDRDRDVEPLARVPDALQCAAH